MTGAVFQHGPKRPGWVYLGTGPKTGQPRDAQGRMILVHEYGPPPNSLTIEPKCAAQENRSTIIVSRGMAAIPQDKLL